jgi:LmbE family N-acetylglucosaminyl deacetylase
MKIMAIGAHPDDLEISCAGTLIKYKRIKHIVGMVCVTDGTKGHT